MDLLLSITISILLQGNLTQDNNPIHNKLEPNKDYQINKEDTLKDKDSPNKDSRIKVILSKEDFPTNKDNSLNKEAFLNKAAILNKGGSRTKADTLSKGSAETPKVSEGFLSKASTKADSLNKAIPNKALAGIPNKDSETRSRDSAAKEAIHKTATPRTTSTKCNVLFNES